MAAETREEKKARKEEDPRAASRRNLSGDISPGGRSHGLFCSLHRAAAGPSIFYIETSVCSNRGAGGALSGGKMATPSELSLEEIRDYLLENGGTARNHDLVKHFKKFLTDPETRVEARNRFKEYVNTLATIKNEEGEKYLVLKKKYRQGSVELSTPEQIESPLGTPNLATPVSPLRGPPPYRPPPPAPLSPSSNNAHASPEEHSAANFEEETTEDLAKNDVDNVSADFLISSPPVPPRRKSQDKLKVENKENVDRNKAPPDAAIKEDEAVPVNPGSTEQLSFRERMQRFNKMASEIDLHSRPNGTTTPTKKRSDKGADEDDSASVASQLDGKSREWLVRAAQGDYQALAKLAAEEPRLTRLKVSFRDQNVARKEERARRPEGGDVARWLEVVCKRGGGGPTAQGLRAEFIPLDKVAPHPPAGHGGLIPWDKLAEPACLRITSPRYTLAYGSCTDVTILPPPSLFLRRLSHSWKLATGHNAVVFFAAIPSSLPRVPCYSASGPVLQQKEKILRMGKISLPGAPRADVPRTCCGVSFVIEVINPCARCRQIRNASTATLFSCSELLLL
ncbi:hypothetical protein KM043_016693 [Ampulex compressa]|nr:hypothetical protein KM043_016693 [Ampulex compressa]